MFHLPHSDSTPPFFFPPEKVFFFPVTSLSCLCFFFSASISHHGLRFLPNRLLVERFFYKFVLTCFTPPPQTFNPIVSPFLRTFPPCPVRFFNYPGTWPRFFFPFFRSDENDNALVLVPTCIFFRPLPIFWSGHCLFFLPPNSRLTFQTTVSPPSRAGMLFPMEFLCKSGTCNSFGPVLCPVLVCIWCTPLLSFPNL